MDFVDILLFLCGVFVIYILHKVAYKISLTINSASKSIVQSQDEAEKNKNFSYSDESLFEIALLKIGQNNQDFISNIETNINKEKILKTSESINFFVTKLGVKHGVRLDRNDILLIIKPRQNTNECFLINKNFFSTIDICNNIIEHYFKDVESIRLICKNKKWFLVVNELEHFLLVDMNFTEAFSLAKNLSMFIAWQQANSRKPGTDHG